MKKLLAGLLVCGILTVTTMPAFAYNGINDVSKDYWAQSEISSVVSDSVMNLKDSNFYPENSISRVEFVKALLKVLGNENLEVKSKIKFTDVAK